MAKDCRFAGLALFVAVASGCGSSSTTNGARVDAGSGGAATGGAGAHAGSSGATSMGGTTSTGGTTSMTGGAAGSDAGTSSAGSGGSSVAGAGGVGGDAGFVWPAACAGRVDGAVAVDLVAHGAELIDVRTPSEYAAGHIDGAVNIPLADLATRMSELDKGRALVVYCASGSRADTATSQLCDAGYKVYDLGPRSNWPG